MMAAAAEEFVAARDMEATPKGWLFCLIEFFDAWVKRDTELDISHSFLGVV